MQNDKLLKELAAKASIDVSDLRNLLAAEARAVINTESTFADVWVEALTFDTVVIGIADGNEDTGFSTTFVEFAYTVTAGVVNIDTASGTEVLRTFEPTTAFEKADVAEGDGKLTYAISLSGKETEDGRRTIEGYASVFGIEDRDGERMQQGAFTKGLSAFLSTPVMMFNHGKDPEVGRNAIGVWKEVREDERGLFVRGELATGDKHADRIWNLVQQGVLNALSVGGHFMKHGKDIFRWDLVEISIATVPSNAFANFHVVKDMTLAPVSVAEAPGLVGRLRERAKSAPESALEVLTAAAADLTDIIERATQLIGDGKAADVELLVRDRLTPAMALGAKALSEGEDPMTLTAEQSAAIAEATAAAIGEAMKDVTAGVGVAVATALDARDTAATKAADEAAATKAAADEHDTEVAKEAAKAAVAEYQDMLRKSGFVPAGATLPIGDKEGTDPETKQTPPGSNPATADAQIIVASGMHKFDRLEDQDLAYYHMHGKATFGQHEENVGKLWSPNPVVLRAMALKSARKFEKGELPSDLGYTVHTSWTSAAKDDQGNDIGGGEPGGKEVIAPWAYKADEVMGSDVAAQGDEWVPTLWTSQLWEQIRLTNQVVSFLAGAGNVVDMPSDPYIIPLESTDPLVRLAPQTDDNTEFTFPGATTTSVVATAQRTMTTGKLMVIIPFTRELEEDAILPIVPQLRRQTEEAMTNGVENAVINGDTTIGAGTNINDTEGTPAGTELFLVADGLRHLGLVTTTADVLDVGVITLGKIRNMRKLMGTNGKMGIRTGDLMMVCEGNTYYELLDLDEVVTADKFGPSATVRTGGLASIDGIRIHPSEEMGLTEADGTIDLDTVADNIKGQLVIFNRRQFRLGFRRRLTMSVERVPFADGGYLVASLRMAFNARDTEGVAIGRNITV